MHPRCIQLLHVEDDLGQRRVIAHHLGSMDDVEFQIHCCDSEEAAVDMFQHQKVELVILDYMLTQGDEASCLRRLRELDSIVPIIAVWEPPGAEITTQLLELGADDFLDKRSLNSQALLRSVREALKRADGFRLRPAGSTATRSKPNPVLEHLCRLAIETLGSEYLCLMSEFEEALGRRT